MKRFLCFLLSAVCLFAMAVFSAGCKNSGNEGCRYEITAEYVPETSTLTAMMKVEYKNETDNEISALKFNMYPNAYRESASYKPVSPSIFFRGLLDGKNYGCMEISSVSGAKNWEVTGEDENILCVYLEESLYPGDKITLDICFLTKLAKINHRTGVAQKAINLGNFFPVLCGYSDGAFYECVYYSDGDPFIFRVRCF